MGRIVTPKYRMEVRTNVGSMTPSSWSGRATEKRLETAVKAENESFLPGGVNAHVSKAHGAVVRIIYARLVEQATGTVVAEYTAPAFEVL